MLSQSDIEKLCFGRIIRADVYNSAGDDRAGPHPAIMIDSDEEIAEELEKQNPEFYVVVVSHDEKWQPQFLVPVSQRVGLTGHVQCAWTPKVALAGIETVGQSYNGAEMRPVLEMIRRAQRSRKPA